MKKLILVLLTFCSSLYAQPNIVYILADDLGYGELGVYGQQMIETPNIDALAGRGMIFTQHYSGAPVCAPARGSLLTGLHTGHAHVRGNDEWASRGDVWSLEAMFKDANLEGQRPLPDSIVTIGEMLQKAGYQTGIVGKWGLGGPETESIPTTQGFNFFYGYNCQRQAHTYYPSHLWKNEEKIVLKNKIVPLAQGLPQNLDPYDPVSYEPYSQNDYSATLMHDEALGFIDLNKNNPFFLYYASPIPHVALQAPEKWVKYYETKFGREEPYTGKSYYPNRTPRATYAAMITYLDEQVGELVQKLKDNGQYENTLIIFTSDNGPSYAGGAPTKHFQSGKPYSAEYGRAKGFVFEGGIRVPMIAAWPRKIKAGSKSDHISAFYDVMATFADISKVEAPSNDGISFLPTLLGKKQKQHEYLFWEFTGYNGQQAIRKGDWKAIRIGIMKGEMGIKLFDLSKDPLELNDIANRNPKVVKEMERIFRENHTRASTEKFRMAELGD
ncbi:arylsulfatase [Spirosomataceae bacterium TFI 002]|nr:arylsulfatase [Spirosomataceae bacterium TFI 002]